jgi:hypothetical protein
MDEESLSFLLFQTFLIKQRLFLLVFHGLLLKLDFGLGLRGVVLRMHDLEVLSAHHLHLHGELLLDKSFYVIFHLQVLTASTKTNVDSFNAVYAI